MIGRTTKPVRLANLSCFEVDDEVLIYDEARIATHRLNATAYFIWLHCDGTVTCERIARDLTRLWDTTLAVARADVVKAVRKLVRNRLVELPR